MMFSKIGAAVLFVQDLDRCVKFYRDALGLQVAITDADSAAFQMEAQDFLLLKVAAAADMVGEEAISPQDRAGRHVLLCVDVENVDTTYQTYSNRGVSFIRPPADQPWGLRTAYFADPEGNLWEIRHSLKSEQPK
jgi:lactoylglutathione lyase